MSSISTEYLHKLSNTSTGSTGSSRTALLLKDSVIKFPRSEVSIPNLQKYKSISDIYHDCDVMNNELDQMFTEWHVWKICPPELRYLLCPILEYGFTDTGMPYTIMQRARTISQWGDLEDFDDLENYFPEDIAKSDDDVKFQYYLNDHAIHCTCQMVEDIETLCQVCNIGSQDFFNNISNIGEINGELTLIDYGWDHYWSEESADIFLENGQVID